MKNCVARPSSHIVACAGWPPVLGSFSTFCSFLCVILFKFGSFFMQVFPVAMGCSDKLPAVFHFLEVFQKSAVFSAQFFWKFFNFCKFNSASFSGHHGNQRHMVGRSQAVLFASPKPEEQLLRPSLKLQNLIVHYFPRMPWSARVTTRRSHPPRHQPPQELSTLSLRHYWVP